MNTSSFSNENTARTRTALARRLAVLLKELGAESVLELCVGPSLKEIGSGLSSSWSVKLVNFIHTLHKDVYTVEQKCEKHKVRKYTELWIV